MAILDYRRARAALDLFNSGREGAQQLADHPEMLELLLEMGRAQSPEMTLDLLLSDLERRRKTDEDDE